MEKQKEMELYVEELDEELDFSTLMFNCVACGTSIASFSCPKSTLSSGSSLSSATS